MEAVYQMTGLTKDDFNRSDQDNWELIYLYDYFYYEF